MPSWRKSEADKNRLDNLTGTVRAKEPVHQEELTAPALRRSHGMQVTSSMDFVKPQSFQHAYRCMNGSMGSAIWAAAVPTAVAPETSVEKELTGFSRLPVIWR
jgi:hypothetical protein